MLGLSRLSWSSFQDADKVKVIHRAEWTHLIIAPCCCSAWLKSGQNLEAEMFMVTWQQLPRMPFRALIKIGQPRERIPESSVRFPVLGSHYALG